MIMQSELRILAQDNNPGENEGEAMPAIVRFWEVAYCRYRHPIEQGLAFHVPQFPVPLLSPNFITGSRSRFLELNGGLIAHFNEIVPLGHDQRGPSPAGFRLDKQFFLGERHIARRELPPGFSARVTSLADAIRSEEYWGLLADGFGRDAPFLRTLLPFLARLEADFRTAFLEEGGKCVGVISVGVAGGAALLLNAAVASSQRGRGISTILTGLAQSVALECGATRAFFWTEHAFFGRHADLFQHYRIFVKSTA